MSGTNAQGSIGSMIRLLSESANPNANNMVVPTPEQLAANRQFQRQSEIWSANNINPQSIADNQQLPYEGSSVTYKATEKVSPFAPKVPETTVQGVGK